jgi:hypothetical protein
VLEQVERRFRVVHRIIIQLHRDLVVVQEDQYLNLVVKHHLNFIRKIKIQDQQKKHLIFEQVQEIRQRKIYFHRDEHKMIKNVK